MVLIARGDHREVRRAQRIRPGGLLNRPGESGDSGQSRGGSVKGAPATTLVGHRPASGVPDRWLVGVHALCTRRAVYSSVKPNPWGEQSEGDPARSRLLGDPVAQQLLESRTLARLAYTWPDGTPRVVPIWFHWTGEVVVMASPPAAPKIRALQRS